MDLEFSQFYWKKLSLMKELPGHPVLGPDISLKRLSIPIFDVGFQITDGGSQFTFGLISQIKVFVQ